MRSTPRKILILSALSVSPHLTCGFSAGKSELQQAVAGSMLPKVRTELGYKSDDGTGEYSSKVKIDRVKNTGQASTEVAKVRSKQQHEVIVNEERERLVVVRYIAPWCQACRAAEPSFRKLAYQLSSDVKFVEMPLKDEEEWDSVGVSSVPFAHIFHPEAGLVEEMKMHRSDMPAVKKVLGDYLDGSCELLTYLFDDVEDGDDEDEQQNQFQ